MMASFFGKPKASAAGSVGSSSCVSKEEMQVARAKSRSESGESVLFDDEPLLRLCAQWTSS